MATYKAPRGSIRDLRFFLKEVADGPLMDQYNWTDGLAHGQWPVVEFWTGPNQTGTNITALVVKNITADTITSASHKDPTGTTGIWRESQGTYWVRVQPQNAIAFDDYYMRVSFQPTSGNTWVEDFSFEVLVPGDVDPSAEISVEDVTSGWSTTMDTEVIQGYIEDATEEVYGYLEEHGITDPEAYVATNGMPRMWRRAIIDRVRCMISTFDLSSGTRVASVQEGSERVSYGTFSRSAMSGDPCADWIRKLDMWLQRNAPGRQLMIGLVTKRVGMTVNAPEGSSSDPDAEVF